MQRIKSIIAFVMPVNIRFRYREWQQQTTVLTHTQHCLLAGIHICGPLGAGGYAAVRVPASFREEAAGGLLPSRPRQQLRCRYNRILSTQKGEKVNMCYLYFPFKELSDYTETF